MPNSISIDEFVNRASTSASPSSTTGNAISIEDFVNRSVQQTPKQKKQKKDALDIATDVVNTVFPMRNVGEAIGTQIAKATVPVEQRKFVAPSEATPGKIAGDIVQNALYFVPGGSIARGVTSGVRTLAPRIAPKTASTIGNIITGAGIGYGVDVAAGVSSGEENPLTPGFGTIVGAAVPGVASRIKPRTPTLAQREEAARKVFQGTERDTKRITTALAGMNKKGVKTSKDLVRRLDEEIKKELKTVDTILATDPTSRRISDLDQVVDINAANTTALPGTPSTNVNYVREGLDQLLQYYKATGEVKKALQTEALTRKANTTGLTAKEINGIARKHGTELKGFNVNGELASGLNKQKFENTRKGLKSTARSFIKNKTAEDADKRASDLIRAKQLAEEMAKKVYKLESRMAKSGILKPLGETAGFAVDVATGGLLRAFLTTLLRNSNVRKRTLDSLDLEKELEKNLRILTALENAPDGQVQAFLQRVVSEDKPVLPGDVILGKRGRNAVSNAVTKVFEAGKFQAQ